MYCEQRLFSRFEVKPDSPLSTVFYKHLDKEIPEKKVCQVLNISYGGMAIVTTRELEKDTPLEMIFELPKEWERKINFNLTGKICLSTPYEDFFYKSGYIFNPEDREKNSRELKKLIALLELPN